MRNWILYDNDEKRIEERNQVIIHYLDFYIDNTYLSL